MAGKIATQWLGVIHITATPGCACDCSYARRRCPNTRADWSGHTAQVNPDLTYGPAARVVAGPLFCPRGSLPVADL